MADLRILKIRTKRPPAGGDDGRPLDGVYACTNCNNVEASEREVACWYCGHGEMIWFDHNAVAAALRIARGPRSVVGDDAARMDWLATKVVNVRQGARYGSRDMFWSSPDEEGEPSDLRAQIDARIANADGRK